MNWNNIPAELRARPQWCITPGTDTDKAPYMTSGAHASSTNDATWTTFEAACDEAARRGWLIGYVLSATDPFACIDLDVKDDTPQETLDEYQRIIDDVDSFTEISRSGKGRHIWLRGKIGKGHKRGGVEVYSQERFLICTGNILRDVPIKEDQPLLTNMMRVMFNMDDEQVAPIPDEPEDLTDAEIFQNASNASNADKYNALCRGEWKELGYKSQSEADLALLGILCFYSKNNAQVRRLFRMTELGKRDKATKNNRYLNLSIPKVRSRMAAEAARTKAFMESPIVKAVHAAITATEAEWSRRTGLSPAPEMDLVDMTSALVLVEGSFVAFLDNPNNALSFEAMRKHMRRNVTTLEDKNGKEKIHQTLDLWLQAGARETADCFGFDPGEYNDEKPNPFFTNAHDHNRKALNLWRPLPRVPRDYSSLSVLAFPFVEHVHYLIPVEDEAEWFLNWCAHIQQKPGELPHHHWLFWTEQHGIGRSTLAKILGRVFEGYTAKDFDLPHYLKSGFNGDLSRRILVYTGEIKEGINFRYEDTFKRMTTDEFRLINPKTLPDRKEKNCARWLLFSNHANAIPISMNDRRFNVVRNPDMPKDADYYTRLNVNADDPDFILIVREYLATRDIGRYNPFVPAKMNNAKRAVAIASGPQEYQNAQQLIETHNSDLIEANDLFTEVFGFSPMPSHSAMWAQLQKLAQDLRIKRLPEFRFHKHDYKVWALRNAHEWETAAQWEIVSELMPRQEN